VKTIAAYVRVSSRGQNTDSQVQEITAWLQNNGYDLTQVEWYTDRVSGKTLKRAEFDRLQKDIFDGTIKTVICWKLDRLSRRLRDGVNLLAEWCEHGLKIIVVTQRIELNGAVGRMIAAVMLGLAEIELEFRQERQTAGIKAAKRKIGADKVYFGRKAGTTKAKPKRALELRQRGLNDPEIATAMGTSVRTVQRYLRTAEAAAVA
jgi:DNA invertase Pin-like site-specific DNA recombinase